MAHRSTGSQIKVVYRIPTVKEIQLDLGHQNVTFRIITEDSSVIAINSSWGLESGSPSTLLCNNEHYRIRCEGKGVPHLTVGNGPNGLAQIWLAHLGQPPANIPEVQLVICAYVPLAILYQLVLKLEGHMPLTELYGSTKLAEARGLAVQGRLVQ